MAVNWWERKEAGVDAQEGAVRDSISNAVFFLERSFKPPDKGVSFTALNVKVSA